MRYTVAVIGWLVVSGCDSDSGREAEASVEPAASPVAAGSDQAPDTQASDSAAPGRTSVQPASKPVGPPIDMEDPNRRPAPDPSKGLPALDPVPDKTTTLLTVEARSPAIRGGRLVQNVGLDVGGGRVAPVLALGCEAPCWSPMPMWPSTAESRLEFTLYRGKRKTTAGSKKLGTFAVESVPAAAAGGHTEVVVGLGVVEGALVVHARVRASGEPIAVVRGGDPRG